MKIGGAVKQADVMRHPADAEAGQVPGLEGSLRCQPIEPVRGLEPLQDLGPVAMLAAVHGVVRELTIIDAVGFPEDGNDQLHAINPGLGNAGMRDERMNGVPSQRPLN
jgi:hypothetical protein